MPLTPLASDYLGRRAALFIGSCIMAAGITLQCLSTTVPMFIGARCTSVFFVFVYIVHGLISVIFLVGFGLAFATNAAPLLITELAYPTQVRIFLKDAICTDRIFGKEREIYSNIQHILVFREHFRLAELPLCKCGHNSH